MAKVFALNPITGELDLVDDDTATGSAFVLRDQSTPQTMTGIADGAIVLKAGIIGTYPIYELATITYFGGL